jgi:hypothetical protein
MMLVVAVRPGFGEVDWVRSFWGFFKVSVAEAERHLARVHEPIEKVIRGVAAELDKLPSDDEEAPWRDNLITDECAAIEDWLGMAFVAAHRQVTTTTTEIEYLSHLLFRHRGRGIPNVSSPLQRGPRTPNGVRAIEFTVAVANFWKHQDEWGAEEWGWYEGRPEEDGKEPKRIGARTAILLRGSGMSRSSSGRIRQLATYAGVTPYDNLQPLRDIVDAWARDVMSSIATEFNLSLD